MNNTNWILLDTETTGLTAPIMVVKPVATASRLFPNPTLR